MAVEKIQIIKDGKEKKRTYNRERSRKEHRKLRQSPEGKQHLGEIQKKYAQSDKGRKYKHDWYLKKMSSPENKIKQKEYDKNRAIIAKTTVLNYYGNECACCNEKRFEFLVIDHINGGGAKHLRELNCSPGTGFYRWLIKNKFPEGFRTLCDNCNMSLGRYGYCPHMKEKKV